MRTRPLPPDLGTAFHVREADVLGIPRRRLAAGDLRAPFHGVRVAREESLESVADRCQAYLPRITGGQFFSHTTAATLWGMPLPFRHGDELHVGATPPTREPRTRGVVGHRLELPQDGVTLIGDLPAPTRVETWAQLGSLLRMDDLVAAGDWVLSQGESVEDLTEAALRARRRGAVALREAVDFVRPGSESPRETQVRLILVRAGLPEPELNWTLRTTTGTFVARLDLAYPEQRVAVEYDGRQHADTEQFRRDADRWRAIADEGWTLIRVVAHHLDTPAQDVVAPVRRALLAERAR
ncbi:endonuclease domain-containing protein [Microbacterium proteolyticum]|uniref:endonuclease domain-containing protein n=1 Tax=Microbacterium proteolyticum TaxID=1572644 RepID=UPI001FABE3A9|nr:DUF559 domain-containing protein [Microbacterium proteolyticum]MCI9858829.1 DUF559 domain-containing protein [Microbacterium proteolyticum]